MRLQTLSQKPNPEPEAPATGALLEGDAVLAAIRAPRPNVALQEAAKKLHAQAGQVNTLDSLHTNTSRPFVCAVCGCEAPAATRRGDGALVCLGCLGGTPMVSYVAMEPCPTCGGTGELATAEAEAIRETLPTS